MPVKKLNPRTSGQRFRIAPVFNSLTRTKPEKALLLPTKRTGGRNNTGKMTMRHRGGGHKKRIRIIDFKRNKYNIPAIVKSIEYDPMRTAHIALLHYLDGAKAYILAPEGIEIGHKVLAGEAVAPAVGNNLPLKAMPTGTILHNIELHPGKGGAMARSAGAYAQLLAKEEKYVTLRLPSGETRKVLGTCMATVGTVSNSQHVSTAIGKAGRNRWLGKRPRVRGVAMNPVDHPMGGGEGKASGGHPRSKTGRYAKGEKTRNKKKHTQRLIMSKRKK